MVGLLVLSTIFMAFFDSFNTGRTAEKAVRPVARTRFSKPESFDDFSNQMLGTGDPSDGFFYRRTGI